MGNGLEAVWRDGRGCVGLLFAGSALEQGVLRAKVQITRKLHGCEKISEWGALVPSVVMRLRQGEHIWFVWTAY